MIFFSPEYKSGINKLERYGKARNRTQDKQVRDVIITDDEALAIFDVLTSYAPDEN